MRKLVGVIVVLLIAGVLIWFGISQIRGGGSTPTLRIGSGGNQNGPFVATRKDAVSVRGFVGGEKLGFLGDPQVERYLEKTYGLLLDTHKAGSTEMIGLDLKEMDFIWPSSSISAEMYEKKFGKPLKEEQVFSSPLVLYSWDEVVAALEQQGLLTKVEGGWYECDLEQLIARIDAGTKWSDVGLDMLYGKMSLTSTDPNKSNSGALFCGLLADIYNGGDTATEASLAEVLPKVKNYFNRLGYMEASSGDFFQQYLETGMGAKPLIVLYENQIVEYSLEHPEQLELIKQKVRVIYPKPTVWAVHPIIALTENGKKLAEALKDPELQKLAWERHGFRTGLAGVTNDPRVLEIAGIPQQISAVVPLPSASVMTRLLSALAQ